MFTTTLEKDNDGFYTHIDNHFTDLFGLNKYHPDMKWNIIPPELGLSTSARASLENIEATVRKKRTPISSTGIWKPINEILQIVTHRTPTIRGGFVTVEHVSKVSDLCYGWPLRLNHHLQVLQLPSGKQLTRKDLSVLSLFASRTPRKKIAHAHCCSVAAIEKRLAKIKDILTPQDRVAKLHSLSERLIELDLLPFLLCGVDHFDPIEFVSPHVAHSRSL
jgi:hypothetical protein